MGRNINAWIAAPFAAPAALLIGSAVWYLGAFGVDGFVVRLLWQSIICFWVLIGSLLLSPVLFYILERVHISGASKTMLAFASVVVAGFFAALFLVGQVTTSVPWLLAAVVAGLSTNGLVFLRAHLSPNRTIERDARKSGARPSL